MKLTSHLSVMPVLMHELYSHSSICRNGMRGDSFTFTYSFIHSFIPLACAECDDSLPFPGASSISLCYITSPSTIFYQPVFHPPSLHLAIYFLVYLPALLLPNLYIILCWEFCFLPFSVHAQTNIIYLTLLSLL